MLAFRPVVAAPTTCPANLNGLVDCVLQQNKGASVFTGIVTDIGSITKFEKTGDIRARIATAYAPTSIDLGASIACDGVCLTVVDRGSDPKPWFDVEISAETVEKTTLSSAKSGWAVGRKLNLERALKVGDELGGHIVSGHVDGTVHVIAVNVEGDSTRIEFEVSSDISRFVAQKGSVALNGVSLTVNDVSANRFGVNLIPHTKAVTTWGDIAVGDDVNIEIDTLARYVARLAEVQN
ncbi:MAG: riboflavin synthase [Paracoccaceae bacterium]|jgi:riboflavin synthase